MNQPFYGWYGDDFTGATDTLGTFAKHGCRAMLFLDIPAKERLKSVGPLDAIGIAGHARSLPPAEMEAELEPVGRFFSGIGLPLLHYKCCSTFDSAPEIGSIGAAIRTLRHFFPNPFVPIVGGQPNIGRYCIFSNLFARAGDDGSIYRIDRHPTMMRHPVTPMHEGDLRLHLEAQGLQRVEALHYPAYRSGLEYLEKHLQYLLDGAPSAILLDVAEQDDLSLLGRLIWRQTHGGPILAIGASSVADALATTRLDGVALVSAGRSQFPAPRMTGPAFVFAGSLSPVTAGQIEAAEAYDKMPLDAGRLALDRNYGEEAARSAALALGEGRNLLVCTAPPEGAQAQTALAAEVGAAGARFVADVVRMTSISRIAIAGGDTSSRVTRSLGLWGLSYTASPFPGIATCRAHSDDPSRDGIQLMLKGGQMGPREIFQNFAKGPA